MFQRTLLARRSASLAVLCALALLLVGAERSIEAAEPNAKAAASDFQNPGVYSHVANGLRYEWIPTEEVGFEIQADGSVRMTAPATKRSTDGTSDCRHFTYDHFHKRLEPREEAALFGGGLKLPVGSYGFAVLWLKADSYEMVSREPWNLTCNPETYRSNSAGADYVYLSIVPVASEGQKATASSSGLREARLPDDLLRASWLPHYQVLPYDLQLPREKGFGITRLLWDVPLEDIYRKVTHIQYMYSVLDDVPENRLWRAMRAYDNKGQLASVEWLANDHSIDPDFITASELDENFGHHDLADHTDRAQRVLEGIYRRMESEAGVTSPQQVRLYDDYFSPLAGYDNSLSFVHDFNDAAFTEGLSSQELARKRRFEGKWEDCLYFTKGAYDYRNWMQGGYLDSYATSPEGIRIYNLIYNLERKKLAAPDRRVLTFGWSNSEGVNSNMYRAGAPYRLRFEQGDILRDDVHSWPFHMMLNESFWALLLGDDYVLWHSSVTLVQDPHAFGDSWCSGARPTRWQPHGGEIVAYDPADSSHPSRMKSPLGQFPNNPHVGETGAFAGAWLVGQITEVSDRTSKGLAYAPFRYSVNGGAETTGYRDSEEPTKGKRGDARLSQGGATNPGQANIVASFAEKKPICVVGEGADGCVAIFQNVYSGLADVTEVTLQTPRGERSFRAVGNRLHVFFVEE